MQEMEEKDKSNSEKKYLNKKFRNVKFYETNCIIIDHMSQKNTKFFFHLFMIQAGFIKGQKQRY